MSNLGNNFFRYFPRISCRTLSSTFFCHSFKTSSKIHNKCFSYSVTPQNSYCKSCAFLNKKDKCTFWTPVCKLTFAKNAIYKPLYLMSFASPWHTAHRCRNWGSSSFNKHRGRRKGRTSKRKDGGKTEIGSKYKIFVQKEKFENYDPAEQFGGKKEDFGDFEMRNLPAVGGERFSSYRLHKGLYFV